MHVKRPNPVLSHACYIHDTCSTRNYLAFVHVYRTGGPSSNKTHPESKCPELLANYCDLLLRKTPLSKKLTSEEIDEKLKSVVCNLIDACFGIHVTYDI